MDSTSSSAVLHRPNTRWALHGFALLMAGVLLYVLFRPADSTQFLAANTSLNLQLPGLVQRMVGILPALLHTAAFSLLTCAVLNSNRSTHAWVCCSWAAINIVFELGQLPAVAHWLIVQFGNGHTNFITAYFLRGTFDFADVLASGLGALLAWSILHSQRSKQ